MISKELFLEILEKIQLQDKKDSDLSDALSDYTKSFVVMGDNLYSECLFEVLKESIDPDEFIQWWLYESVEKIVWYKDKKGKEITVILDTAEKLYEFLVKPD